MNSTTSAVNLARGLSLLMMHEGGGKFRHLDDCGHYTVRHSTHPFDLDIPKDQDFGFHFDASVMFVGANATETSVDVFLANIRFWAGYVDGRSITKLRVITVPFPGRTREDQHYVFFEAWCGSDAIISGETTDFSGGGNTAREILEDVFAVLAMVYSLEIERVETGAVSLRELYNTP